VVDLNPLSAHLRRTYSASLRLLFGVTFFGSIKTLLVIQPRVVRVPVLAFAISVSLHAALPFGSGRVWTYIYLVITVASPFSTAVTLGLCVDPVTPVNPLSSQKAFGRLKAILLLFGCLGQFVPCVNRTRITSLEDWSPIR
jgi:hypothetical protein